MRKIGIVVSLVVTCACSRPVEPVGRDASAAPATARGSVTLAGTFCEGSEYPAIDLEPLSLSAADCKPITDGVVELRKGPKSEPVASATTGSDGRFVITADIEKAEGCDLVFAGRHSAGVSFPLAWHLAKVPADKRLLVRLPPSQCSRS